MVGTVCGLFVFGSTLWGTRHADSAKSAIATTLDTPLPFSEMEKARGAPAPIWLQQGRFAVLAARERGGSTTALSGFQDIVGPLGKRFVASSRFPLEVAEHRPRID